MKRPVEPDRIELKGGSLYHNIMHFNLNFIPKRSGVFIVGGTVRDAILGLSPKDYDIATFDPPEAVAGEIARTAGGRPVCIGKPGKQIYRIVTRKHTFDISAARGNSIEDDLIKRDFTINAIAFDVTAEKIIDPWNGRLDLDAGIIRTVSEDAFADDPLRLLRAFRIAAGLGFSIAPATLAAIGKAAPSISNVAGERIREEWLKLLNAPGCFPYMRQMSDSGLLSAIFPEMAALKDIPKTVPDQVDLYSKSMQALKYAEQLLEQNLPLLSADLQNRDLLRNPAAPPLFKHAALLHNIGNRSTSPRNGNNKKKCLRSADMAIPISDRLRTSNREKHYIDVLIRNHAYLRFLFAARLRNRLSRTAITRFFMKTVPLTPDVIILSVGVNLDDSHQFTAFAREMLCIYRTGYLPQTRKPPLISGTDLIQRFNLPPSALIAALLERVETRRLAGLIHSRDEAFSVAKKILDRKSVLDNP